MNLHRQPWFSLCRNVLVCQNLGVYIAGRWQVRLRDAQRAAILIATDLHYWSKRLFVGLTLHTLRQWVRYSRVPDANI